MFPQVCGHICRCYSVAAQFEECREKIIELPNIIRDLCRILYYGKVRNRPVMFDYKQGEQVVEDSLCFLSLQGEEICKK